MTDIKQIHLEQRVKELTDMLNSVGEWIWQAEIAVEPGWVGSQQDVLSMINEVLGKIRCGNCNQYYTELNEEGVCIPCDLSLTVEMKEFELELSEMYRYLVLEGIRGALHD